MKGLPENIEMKKLFKILREYDREKGEYPENQYEGKA